MNRLLVANADYNNTPVAGFAAFGTIARQQGTEAATALIDAIPIHLFSIKD